MSRSILNPDQVQEIRYLLWKGNHTQQEIAEMYGVKRPTIGAIKLKKSWTHV